MHFSQTQPCLRDTLTSAHTSGIAGKTETAGREEKKRRRRGGGGGEAADVHLSLATSILQFKLRRLEPLIHEPQSCFSSI